MQQLGDLLLRGQAVAAVEAPRRAQHAAGDVEQAVAHAMAHVRVIEQLGRFVVDRDAPAACGMDRRDHAVVAVAAVLGLDTACLGLGQHDQPVRACLVDTFKQHLAGAGHGLEAAAPAAGRGLERDCVGHTLQKSRV